MMMLEETLVQESKTFPLLYNTFYFTWDTVIKTSYALLN